MKKPRSGLMDSIFLLVIELLSALPYVFKLGFYTDDWASQAALARSSNQGIAAMVQELLKQDPGMRVRPVQVAYLVAGFKAFGRYATAYHIINSILLGLTTVLLYLALRELRIGRWIAFVVALLFGLLPHYSTARFWISSQQAMLSMAFAFLGIHALLKSVQPQQRRRKAWLTLAILSFTLSLLSYEVALGLIVTSLLLIGVREYIRMRGESRFTLKGLGGPLAGVLFLFVVGILKAKMQTRLLTHGHFVQYFLAHVVQQSWHAIVQAVQFDFWTYGLNMPNVIVNLHRHSALSLAACISASIIAILVTFYLWTIGSASPPGRRTCLALIFSSFPIFFVGFLLFFFDPGADFSTAGIDNRITVAAAIAASCALAGTVGLASSVLKSEPARIRVCSVALGVICGINCLVLNGIAFYWISAASQQSAILETVARNIRSLPKNSVVLFDGFCRYDGPGIVFETDWDSTGAIQLVLGDFSLSSDVVSPSLLLTDSTVKTTIYGDPEGNFPYGNHLFVFNVQKQTLTNLPSREAAETYFQSNNPGRDSGCPAAREVQRRSIRLSTY